MTGGLLWTATSAQTSARKYKTIVDLICWIPARNIEKTSNSRGHGRRALRPFVLIDGVCPKLGSANDASQTLRRRQYLPANRVVRLHYGWRQYVKAVLKNFNCIRR